MIKMYGGVMFPNTPLEKTPKSWLFRLRKLLGSKPKAAGERGGPGELGRADSTSSNSSSLASQLN